MSSRLFLARGNDNESNAKLEIIIINAKNVLPLPLRARRAWQSLSFGVIASAAWQSLKEKMHLFYEIASFHSQ